MVFYVNRLDGNGNSVPIVVGLKNTNTNDVFGIETIVHEAGAFNRVCFSGYRRYEFTKYARFT